MEQRGSRYGNKKRGPKIIVVNSEVVDKSEPASTVKSEIFVESESKLASVFVLDTDETKTLNLVKTQSE